MIAKHLLCLSIVFCSLFVGSIQSAYAVDKDLSDHTIDLNHAYIPNQFGFGQILYANSAFNGAPEISAFISMLKNRYNIEAAVETGSQYGYTTSFLASTFDEVHTIEIVPSTYQVAQNNLRNFSNVTCHLGSSNDVLQKILPALESKPVLFYLDAHWEEYWPLLDEIEEISKTHKDNCIIVIDDVRVPGRPDIGYDWNGDNECSYEYVKNKLEKIYSSYDFYYLLPRRIESKAKLVVIPKKWAPL
jgi:predicted O-methyltransferase YrrM